MTNQLQVFKHEAFGEVRTILIGDKPYFMASDVARALGYANISDAVNRHCRAIVKHDTPISGKIQEVNYIPEGDVYRLIIRSKLPQAEKFEKWVFDVVLPSIRKHGGYIANQENLTPEQLMAKALIVAQKVIAEKDKLLEEQKPKVLFAEALETSQSSILVGELAKLLKQNGVNIGQNRLFDWLRTNGFLMTRGESRNMPTQYSMERGLFEIKVRTINNPDGSLRETKTPKVTGKGQIYFVNRLMQEKEVVLG